MKNARYVKVLKGAKALLWDGASECDTQVHTHEYICSAIQSYCMKHYPTDSIVLKKLIHSRLGGYATFRNWLQFQCDIPAHELTNKAVQAHRHAWLDELIAEFSA